MSFVEIIGFIISFLALIYLFFKQQSIARYRQEHPDAFNNEELIEEDPLEEFMSTMEKKRAARKKAQHLPPPPPSSKKSVQQTKKNSSSSLEDYRLASQIEKRKIKSSLENRQLTSHLHRHLEERASHSIVPSLHHPITDHIETEPSRAQIAIQRLTSRRDLIIYQEIIDKPKSMRLDP